MRRLLFTIATCVLSLTSTAAAAEPVHSRVEQTVTSTATDICTFPVTISSTITGTETDLLDAAGNVIHIEAAVTETDTFIANGKALTGLPYHYSFHGTFDENGNVTRLVVSGLATVVPLPDGSVFRSAGRVDFIANPRMFAVTPDVGHAGNVAALCAALAP